MFAYSKCLTVWLVRPSQILRAGFAGRIECWRVTLIAPNERFGFLSALAQIRVGHRRRREATDHDGVSLRAGGPRRYGYGFAASV